MVQIDPGSRAGASGLSMEQNEKDGFCFPTAHGVGSVMSWVLEGKIKNRFPPEHSVHWVIKFFHAVN